MAQPTQDTDITSSFRSNDSLQSRNLFSKEMTVNNKSNMNLSHMYEHCTAAPETLKTQEFQDVKSNTAIEYKGTLPWLTKFNKLMCSSVGNRSYQLLQHLLLIYRQNILTSVDGYCLTTSEIIKLKNHLSNTLIFFHFYWHNIKEHVNDHSSYLNEMSLLLGIYIDMELKATKQSKDTNKLVARFLTILWVYLNNSEEYIFRVLLRIKLITKKYMKICDPILMKSFTTLRRSTKSITDMDYIRYLLILKLWKRLKDSTEEKRKINKLAVMILGTRMPKMCNNLLKIIPKPPIERQDQTSWLLQPNVFDLKQVCDNFIALEETMYTTVEFKDIQSTSVSDLNDCQKTQITSICGKNYFYEYAADPRRGESQINSENGQAFKEAINNKSTEKIHLTKRNNKHGKYKTTKSLKPGEVIFIDLTAEEESNNIGDNKKKRQKNKRNLGWLKMVSRKNKIPERINGLKCKSQVEIADAHSTECSENFVDKVHVEYLPISDNKVSESTESCASLESGLSQDDYNCINPKSIHDCKNRSKDCTLQHKQCDICAFSLQQDDTQHNRVLCLLKLLNIIGYDVKDPKTILNIIRESKEQDVRTSQSTFLHRNTSTYSAITTQVKEQLFTEQGSSIETMSLSKECQSINTKPLPIKQELPTSTDYNVTTDCHLHNVRPVNGHTSEIPESMKQKQLSEVDECLSCCKRAETEPFSYNTMDNVSPVKVEDAEKTVVVDTVTDKKSICDKNIMCMLSDLDKCMDVLNRIGEHIMSVHAEKQRGECQDRADVCAVSTTVLSDQIAESSLGSFAQNMNSLTSAEKLNKILGLCNKKEFLNTCSFKDFCTSNTRGTENTLNQGEYDLQNYKQQTMVSTSELQSSYTYKNDDIQDPLSQNKLEKNFMYNHIKTEYDESVDDPNSNKKGALTINTHPTDSAVCDIKDSKEIIKQDLSESFSEGKFEIAKTMSMDEFENIDILDSILNGDLTMEDEQEILEDSQSSMMSPIDYDNSSNVLNCITEFFAQSENSYTNKKEDKSYVSSDVQISSKPLPEGSLGTTGILNSLLDFELTDMDSPPNDFMYSHVPAVNPRLIKKSVGEDIFPTTTCGNISGLQTQQDNLFLATDTMEDSILQKNLKPGGSQNNNIESSVDLVGFGLNTNTQEPHESPSLIRNLSMFSDRSATLINSTVMSSELNQSLKYSAIQPTHKHDSNYVYQKDSTSKRVQSLTDLLIHPSAESYASKTVSSNLSTSSPDQTEEFSSPLNRTSTLPLQLRMTSVMSSTNPRSRDMSTASEDEVVEHAKLLEAMPSNSSQKEGSHESIQYTCGDKPNHTVKHRIDIHAEPRTSKRKLRYDRRNKGESKEQMPSAAVQSNSDQLNLRYSQLSFNPSDREDTHGASCRQKSPYRMCNSKSTYKQLKCVGIQQLRNLSRQKQQILLDLHEKSIENVAVESSTKSGNTREAPKCDSVERTRVVCTSSGRPKSSHSRNRTRFSLSKRSAKVDEEVVEVNVTKDKYIREISSDVLTKSGTQLLVESIDRQSSRLIKKQATAANLILDTEGAPLKRRKITSKFLPIIETDMVVCTMDQQESQEKSLVSMKTDFVCTSRRRNAVGE